MKIWEILITALALSADAFAVALCKGLSTKKIRLRHALITGLYFGLFQAAMPCLGFWLGNKFKEIISSFAPITAFIMLCLIGINMLLEARRDAEIISPSFTPRIMLPLSLATSIDALAAGTSLALMNENRVVLTALIIGTLTLFISSIGVYVGNFFGAKFKSGAEITGGIILILIGIKTFVEFVIS